MLFNTNLPKQLNKSQRIYLTADQHYGHRKIIQYSNRPFKDLDEMNKVLKENHNKVVRPNDHIIHIGDFLFGKAYDLIRLLRELNGHHYLIDGSHDQALEDVCVLTRISSSDIIRKNELFVFRPVGEVSVQVSLFDFGEVLSVNGS